MNINVGDETTTSLAITDSFTGRPTNSENDTIISKLNYDGYNTNTQLDSRDLHGTTNYMFSGTSIYVNTSEIEFNNDSSYDYSYDYYYDYGSLTAKGRRISEINDAVSNLIHIIG